jgi:hypothetical protein
MLPTLLQVLPARFQQVGAVPPLLSNGLLWIHAHVLDICTLSKSSDCRFPYLVQISPSTHPTSPPQKKTNPTQTRHPALLYVASELTKAFAREPSAQAALGPILAALIVSSCQELGGLQNMTARPDLTDDLFLLAGRALNYSPTLIVTPQVGCFGVGLCVC